MTKLTGDPKSNDSVEELRVLGVLGVFGVFGVLADGVYLRLDDSFWNREYKYMYMYGINIFPYSNFSYILISFTNNK